MGGRTQHLLTAHTHRPTPLALASDSRDLTNHSHVASDAAGPMSARTSASQSTGPNRSSFFTSACVPLFACYALFASVVVGSALGLPALAAAPVRILAALAVLLVTLFAMFGAETTTAPSQHGSRLVENTGAGLWFFGLTVVVLDALIAALLPVGAYDALGYRLPAMAQWLDADKVVWVKSDDALRNGYALGLEVLMAASTRIVGDTALIDVLALVFVMIGACALAGLAQELGLPRGAARIAGGAFLLVPIHVLNATSGYADAAFAGAVAATLAFSSCWAQSFERRTGLVVALGCSAAFTCALKSHGFVLAALILSGAGFVRVRRDGFSATARELCMLGILCIPGMFFVLRNLTVTGNPIYPVEVRIIGHLLFPGTGSLDSVLSATANLPQALQDLPSWLRPLRVWLQLSGPAVDFDDRLAGLGYAFPLIALPAMLWVCTRALRHRDDKIARTLGLMLVSSGLCLIVQPMTFWSRYTSWLWAPGALASAYALLAIERVGRRRLALLLALMLSALIPIEGAFALAHVKRIDQYGLSVFTASSSASLARIAGLDPPFIASLLAGRSDVCRTPWRDGTDDANLDGIAAQLSPRPQMHIIDALEIEPALRNARARHCRELIVVGDSALVSQARAAGLRVHSRTAFGVVRIIALRDSESPP